MLGWARKTRCEAVCELAPLRVSDDLSADETELVDRHVQRCGACRAVLESFEQSRAILTEASFATATISDDMPNGTMWSRIEPRLGPAGRFRRRALSWISTPQLAAACLGLFGFTVYNESESRLNASRSMVSTKPATRAIGAVPVGRNTGINVGSVASPRFDQRRFELPTSNSNRPFSVNIGGQAIETEFVPALGLVLADTVGRIGGNRFQENEGGPIVVGVIDGWLGGRYGIRNGDAIVAVNDRPIYSPSDVQCAIGCCSSSRKMILRVLRDGLPNDVVIQLRQNPQAESSDGSNPQEQQNSAYKSIDRLRVRIWDPR